MHVTSIPLTAAPRADAESATPLRWATWLIGLQTIASELDFAMLGIPPSAGLLVCCIMPLVLVPLRAAELPQLLASRPIALLALWLGWMTATVAWSIDPTRSTVVVASSAGLLLCGAWFTFRFGFDAFARTFTVASGIFLAAGLVQDLVVSLASGSWGRFDGLAVTPTSLGRFALVSLVMSTIRAVRTRPRHWLDWLLPAISGLALVATGTRSTLAGALVCLLVISVIVLGVARTLLIGSAMVATVGVLMVVVPEPTRLVSRDEQGADLESFNGRMQIWRIGKEAVEARPVLGHGFGATEDIYELARSRGEIDFMASNAHNIALENMVAGGLVGLALFVLALGAWLASPSADPRAMTGVTMLAVVIPGFTEAVFSRQSSTLLLIAALFVARSRPVAHGVSQGGGGHRVEGDER